MQAEGPPGWGGVGGRGKTGRDGAGRTCSLCQCGPCKCSAGVQQPPAHGSMAWHGLRTTLQNPRLPTLTDTSVVDAAAAATAHPSPIIMRHARESSRTRALYYPQFVACCRMKRRYCLLPVQPTSAYGQRQGGTKMTSRRRRSPPGVMAMPYRWSYLRVCSVHAPAGHLPVVTAAAAGPT